MVDHHAPSRDSRGTFERLNPGMAGLANCESLFTYPKTEKMAAGECLVRHFFSIQHALEEGDSENAYWPPGAEYHADG